MKKRKAVALLFLMLWLLTSLCGCAGGQDTAAASQDGAAAEAVAAPAATAPVQDDSGMFTDRDREIGYDESESAHILLEGDSAQCDSNAVQISGSTVTILDEGTYILSGSLENGMVIVNAEKTDKLQLVLDGADIHSQTCAPIYIRQADKVFITLAGGTANALSNGGQFTTIDDSNIDAVIFSREDLTLNGQGSLSITSPAGHGVVSKDDLVVTSGSYDIYAASHGLDGKDSVRLAGGSFAITAGKDAIHAENQDDDAKGYLYIAGGTFVLTSEGDGLSAESSLQIVDGDFTLLCGGGSQSADPWAEDTMSAKGVKAAGSLALEGGTFKIDASDDGIHANGDITISGGAYQIATGDDGIHADGQVTIAGGSIDITQSYEGIEGLVVDISGGHIRLVASDDGLNAAGGNDQSGFGGRRGRDSFAATEGAEIIISGGTLYVNASGDGIDSNGNLTVTGGQTYVSGPESSMNGALDYNGQAAISGGVFLAEGASGMAQNFGSASTQGAMLMTVESQSGGSLIELTDESGQVIVSWQAEKSFNSVLISCPQLVQGETYTLSAGGYTTQITLDSLVYGAGGWGDWGDGGGGSWGGGRRGRR